MPKLTIKNLKITFPKSLQVDPNEAEFVEWMEWELGLRHDIKVSNPLSEIELKDCGVSADEWIIDGKPIKL